MGISTSNYDIVFFEEYLRNKKRLSESSIDNYIAVIQRFFKEDRDINDVASYNDFLIKYSIKKRATHYYSVLKSFIEFKFTAAADRNRLFEKLIVPPKKYDIKQERKHLPENKIIEIINNLDSEKHRVVALIQTLTGIRAGDVLRTPRKNIVSEEYQGTTVLRLNIIGKRRKRNVIFIHDKIGQQLVMKYLFSATGWEDYPFLDGFQTRSLATTMDIETRIVKKNYLYYWRDLKEALSKANIDKKDFATHDFRRCFARRAWEKYKDIHVLMNLLNHKDPATTIRYLTQSGLRNIDYLWEMQQ